MTSERSQEHHPSIQSSESASPFRGSDQRSPVRAVSHAGDKLLYYGENGLQILRHPDLAPAFAATWRTLCGMLVNYKTTIL